MDNHFLAHTADDGREQTVLAHLQGTANLAEGFAAQFGEAKQGKLMGLAHDLGKYSDAFQDRLLRNGSKVDHATAGAIECLKAGHVFAALAVSGHHGGLPNLGSQTDTEGSFYSRIRSRIPPYACRIDPSFLLSVPPDRQGEPTEDMFFTRMLYSCLVDGDFLDTEQFMQNHPRATPQIKTEVLYEKLLAYIAPWFPPKGELNAQRCTILERCLNQGNRCKPGLFTLTVPTGGGKTVASLAFALAQAKQQKMQRIIYVIPYTSIIEQTASVFRRILGEDTVLEHHSGVPFEENPTDTETDAAMALATENWDAPVIVTTAVQFFESLYSAKPSRCRKLHNIARSVVIFDEAQMIPLGNLRPCVHAISQLVKRYGVSALLCTATQPALEPLFDRYLSGTRPQELCPQDIICRENFRRVSFRSAGVSDRETIAEQMQRTVQALCIVNSRKSAQALFSLLKGEGCYHLSTLMCPMHRRRILEEIRQRLQGGQVCRVVATSLIEAGVDVDFPTVFREEAGLDSVLQAAGRCNREGKRSPEDSVVTVFRSEDAAPPLFRTAIGVFRQIQSEFPQIDAQEAIHRYFQEYFSVKGAQAQDKNGVLTIMEQEPFCFRKVQERLRMIDSDTFPVCIPMDETAQMCIAQVRSGTASRACCRTLNTYSVNIYPQHFRALDESGALEILESGMAVLTDMRLYSQTTGLSLTADSGQALFI